MRIGVLDGRHMFSARPFGSLSFGVGHLLSLAKLLEARPFNAGRVEKQILGFSGVDEAKALVRELLDRTFSHSKPFKKFFADGAQHRLCRPSRRKRMIAAKRNLG